MEFKYNEIKESYLEIKLFLENASGMKIENLNTRIVEDLGLWGDDNYFLLIDYVKKYNINFDNFDYQKHFDSEGELFNGGQALITLILMPFMIIERIIKLIFPKTKTCFNYSFLPKMSEKADLTFGDLVASKLKKEFCLRKNTNIQIG